jgi:hypothetical protein
MESKDAASAVAQMQGTFTAVRCALARRAGSLSGTVLDSGTATANPTGTMTGTGTLHTTQHTQAGSAAGAVHDGDFDAGAAILCIIVVCVGCLCFVLGHIDGAWGVWHSIFPFCLVCVGVL